MHKINYPSLPESCKNSSFAECMDHLPNLPPRRVVLYARVSTQQQKPNQEHQKSSLVLRSRRRGDEVVGKIAEIDHRDDVQTPGRLRAKELARQHDATIVVTEPNRWYGTYHWGSKPKGIFKTSSRKLRIPGDKKEIIEPPPSLEEVKRIQADLGGVKIASIAPPDSSEREQHSHAIKRGLAASPHQSGRPKKDKEPAPEKRRYRKLARDFLIDEVQQTRKEGKSFRQMQKEFGVPYRTLCRWCQLPSSASRQPDQSTRENPSHKNGTLSIRRPS